MSMVSHATRHENLKTQGADLAALRTNPGAD